MRLFHCKSNLVIEMYLPEIDAHCVGEAIDGPYPFNSGHLDHDCSMHELSALEQLVCRELKNICSELSTVDDDSDEHLLVKARCQAISSRCEWLLPRSGQRLSIKSLI